MSSCGREPTAAFDSVVDPRELRIRVSVVILGYANEPFRVQEPDWRTMALLLDSISRVTENPARRPEPELSRTTSPGEAADG